MLTTGQKADIKNFIEYWVKEVNDIYENGLYYSVEDKDTGDRDFDYPYVAGYSGKEIHVSHLDLVAEAMGFKTTDIVKNFVYQEEDKDYVRHFVYFKYKDVNILSVMDLDEYENLLNVLKENDKGENHYEYR